MRHTERNPSGSTTCAPPAGVNRTLPYVGSSAVTENSVPAQAVPCCPRAAAAIRSTSGSGAPQRGNVPIAPHDASRVIPPALAQTPPSPALQTVIAPSGALLVLTSVSDAGSAVAPSSTCSGNVAVAERIAVAWAADGAIARHVASAASSRAARRCANLVWIGR